MRYQSITATDTMSDSGNIDALASLTAPIIPVATYFDDSDCVEYIREDTIAIHRRIDEFLTLIFDETRITPIGFKLKGFKCIYNECLVPLKMVKGVEFVELVPALEYVCTKIGNAAFADDKRRHAYGAAMKLAKDVRLYDAAA
jgi:hypothetical protein